MRTVRLSGIQRCVMPGSPWMARALGTIAVVFVAASSGAEMCKTFTPDPATFPIIVPMSGTAHNVTTLPNGAHVVSDTPFRYGADTGSPWDIATIVFGDRGIDLFQRCAGAFTLARGSGQFNGNPPFIQQFEVTAHLEKHDDTISIVERGHNDAPNNDGAPCSEAAPCLVDDLQYETTYEYHVTTGAMTLKVTSSSHVIWPDPATGNLVEVTAPASGSLTTVVPVTVDKQFFPLLVQPSAVHFGALKSDSLVPRIRRVLLTNRGTAPVIITGFSRLEISITCLAEPFRVGIPALIDESYYIGRVINPGSSQALFVTFDPAQCSAADQQMVLFIQTDENPGGYAVILAGTVR
jgi:hypothetical protein